MHCLWWNKSVSNWPPCASLLSLWTSPSDLGHRISKWKCLPDLQGLSPKLQEWWFSAPHSNRLRSTTTKHQGGKRKCKRKRKGNKRNKTWSKRRMESTVSGTDNQEGRHVSQPSMLSKAKLDINLIRTSPQPVTYTTAQLHENFKKSPKN